MGMPFTTRLVLAFALAASFPSLAAEYVATVLEPKAPAYVPSGDGRLRVKGHLPRDAELEVLGRTKDGRHLKVAVKRQNGERTEVFVRSKDVRLRKLEAAAPAPEVMVPDEIAVVAPSGGGAAPAEPAPKEDPYEPKHPWSFGAGMGGYSSRGQTNFSISGDVRYLWRTYTETLFGLDFAFGSTTAVGLRAGQRLYGVWSEKFRPYVHGGYRIASLSDGDTSALELGGGFQVWYGGGSYFELGAFYLWNTLFYPAGENGVVFGGSSGIRF
jgi:hypothetical protein